MFKNYFIKILVLLIVMSCKNSNEVKDNGSLNSINLETKDDESLNSKNNEEIKPYLKFIGEWVYSYQTQSSLYIEGINIQEDGDFISVKYTVVSLGTLNTKEYDFLGNYKDGMIFLDNQRFSNIKYSEKQNGVYFEGNIYKKKVEKKPLVEETENYAESKIEELSNKENKIIEEKTKSINFKVTEDNLRLRESPNLSAIKITNLTIDTVVLYLNEKSNQKVEVEINNETFNNYWYKVKTDIGEIGWIHGCCFEQQ